MPTTLEQDQAKAARQGKPGYDILGDPIVGYKPVVGEPAVLSSVSGENNFGSKVQPKIDKANETLTAAQRAAKEAVAKAFGVKMEGDPIPPDVQAEMDSFKTEEERAYDARIAGWDKQKEDAQKAYDSLTLAQTAASKAQIASLTNQWTERRALLEKSNKANEAQWQQQFFRFGQAEYSPGMTSDMITGKEQEGIRKVAELDEQYNTKVAEINAALASKQFAQAAALTQDLSAIEEKALEAMHSNAKEARETNKKLRETEQKNARNVGVATAFAAGYKTAADVLDYLRATGGDYGELTLDEIDKALKIINPEEKFTGLDDDYQTYRRLQKDEPETVKGMDFIDYKNAVYNATHKATGGTTTPGISPSGQTEQEFIAEYHKANGGYGGLDEALKKWRAGNVSRPDPKSNYTATSIPSNVRAELESDITKPKPDGNMATLAELYAAYPDVSSSYVSSLFNSLRKKKEDAPQSDEEFLKQLDTIINPPKD